MSQLSLEQAPNAAPSRVRGFFSGRATIFLVEIVYLLAAWALAVLYIADVLDVRHTIGGMPVPVPWFGALGAILISLTGTIQPRGSWKRDIAYWHWARPLMGATVAVIAVLIVQAGVVVISTDPSSQTTKSPILYFLVAFLVGYREETFRDLMKRLVDVVLTPGTDVPPTLTKVAPEHGRPGDPVTIGGAHLAATRSVSFGGVDAPSVDVKSDALVTTVAPQHDAGQVTVVLEAKGGTAIAAFTYDAPRTTGEARTNGADGTARTAVPPEPTAAPPRVGAPTFRGQRR
jgi:hypothetical protein